MADDKSDVGGQDRARVAGGQDYETRHFAEQNGITIEVDGELVSAPYIEITADVMSAFGVEAEIDTDTWQRFHVAPGQRYEGGHYIVEPDASNASYFFALAAEASAIDWSFFVSARHWLSWARV